MKPFSPGIGPGGGRAFIECLAPTSISGVAAGCCFIYNAWCDWALDSANQHDMRRGFHLQFYILLQQGHMVHISMWIDLWGIGGRADWIWSNSAFHSSRKYFLWGSWYGSGTCFRVQRIEMDGWWRGLFQQSGRDWWSIYVWINMT